MPLLASLFLLRWEYVWHYGRSLRKARIHVAAVGTGPLEHYIGDVMGRVGEVPEEIHGSCVQCGNCCMERRCAFLEPAADHTFQCGIYDSFWRRFSNCGSFPLNQHDIDRYACPSYYTVSKRGDRPLPTTQLGLQPVPIRFVRNVNELR